MLPSPISSGPNHAVTRTRRYGASFLSPSAAARRLPYSVRPQRMHRAVAVALVAASTIFSSQLAAAAGLCASTEVTRFSCVIRGSTKTASVCSSATLTRTEGYLQYRFGTLRNVEMVFPKSFEATQTQFTFESHREHGDWESLDFQVGGNYYSVIRWVKLSPMADTPSASEVQVTTTSASGTPQYTTLRCRANHASQLMNLGEVIEWPR